MAETVAEQLVNTLADAGVRRVYGIVGDSLNPVTDAIRRSETVDWIHVRNEEAGAFAAGADAELTGQLAVCAGSCGPGNLHLINGLFDAHRNMAPVLAIAAHIPSAEIGTDFPYDTFMPTSPRIAQVDVRPERLGRRSKLDLGLCGDVGDTIAALLPLVEAKADRAFLDRMCERHEHARRKLRAYVEHVGTRRPIHPEYVAATLDELASPEAV